jgi:C4-dicarboxylate-specific signal transduction histidine kinase
MRVSQLTAVSYQMRPLNMNKAAAMKATNEETSRLISPLRLLASLLVVLFIAEAVIMFTLPLFFHTSIDAVDNFADSVMLILISAPFLWFLIARPLHTTAKEIERLNVSLATRAAELEKQNVELQKTYHDLELETAARHRTMEELREKEQLLIQQSRMAAMGEMLGNIAHQWRQPLNALGVKVQELGLSFEYGELSKELLNANISTAMEILQHLSQTITVFQNFTVPDKEKSLFSVEQVIATTIQIMDESLRKDGITLNISSTGDPQINGYPNEYSQVLMNLVLNAKDAFLEQKTADPRISVILWSENGKSVVTITDNGGGIREDIIDKIFDPYFTTKSLGKGTGVGLFLSKSIIEKNMQGRITVRNVEGGSEFRIEV